MASSHVDNLKKAREKFVATRRTMAEGIAKSGDIARVPSAESFTIIQGVLELIDAAIKEESASVKRAAKKRPK